MKYENPDSSEPLMEEDIQHMLAELDAWCPTPWYLKPVEWVLSLLK